MCICHLLDFSPSFRRKIDYYFFIKNDSTSINWSKMNIFDEFKLWGKGVTIDQAISTIKCIRRWQRFAVMRKYHRFFCNDDRMLMIFPSELWLKVCKFICRSLNDVSKLDRFLSIDNHLLFFKDPSFICDPNDPPMWTTIPLYNIDRKFIKELIRSLIQNRKSPLLMAHMNVFVKRLNCE